MSFLGLPIRKPCLEVPVEITVNTHYYHEWVEDRGEFNGRFLGYLDRGMEGTMFPNFAKDFTLSQRAGTWWNIVLRGHGILQKGERLFRDH